jgi:phage replication-related protein YjqB (UPF0714/DUF867 family)
MKKITFLSGMNNKVLVVAPHREETGTGKIARKTAKLLSCPAIINEQIKRDDSDLNSYKGATKHPDYLRALKDWANIKRNEKPLVIWFHGHRHKPMCIFGYGQPDELIADEETVRALVSELSECGVECVRAGEQFEQFAARQKNNMAQFFKREGFEVNSVQLELSKQIRGMFADDFSETLSSSIKSIFKSVDEKSLPGPELVERAASNVIEILSGHLFEAALEIGRYFIETLYEGDYERARNPRTSKGKISFHKVCKRVHEQGGPSIRWLYNALKLAVNEYDYGPMKAYAELSLSKKVALFPLDDNPEAKRELIVNAADENMTTRQIKTNADERYINLMNGWDKRKPYEPTLEEKEKILTNKIERRQRKIKRLQDEIDKLQAELDSVRSQLNDD